MVNYAEQKNYYLRRVTLIQVLLFVFVVAILARLFYLQIVKHEDYLFLADKRHHKIERLLPERGSIFLMNDKEELENEFYTIAGTQENYLLYGVPVLIENATATIAEIEKVLPMDDETRWRIFLRLSKDDPYEPIQNDLTKEEKEKLEAKKIEGIGFQAEGPRPR